MSRILSVWVDNKPGVLARIAGLIARRGFNIESLAVSITEEDVRSRVTMVVDADERIVEQVTKQLHKLINVYKVTDGKQPQTELPENLGRNQFEVVKG